VVVPASRGRQDPDLKTGRDRYVEGESIMRNRISCLLLFLALGPLARAQDCPWLPDSRMDEAYPRMAPWNTLAGGVGRCKFISTGRRPNNVLTLTSMVKASPREAQSYVRSLHDSMAKTYQARPLPAIGPGGFSVRQRDDETSGFLTLVGHSGKVVVMAQLSFRAPVTDAEEAVAVALTKETFTQADDPVAQKAATTCPYFDEAGLRKLLPGKGLEVQVFGETSCMAQSGKSVLVLSIVDADDPPQMIAALAGGGCRTEAVEPLGPGATLSWGCTGGNPRASVRYAEPHRVVELHLTPGREPTAEERKSLVELARLARARHVAP
jgi:hypothetical protein